MGLIGWRTDETDEDHVYIGGAFGSCVFCGYQSHHANHERDRELGQVRVV